ncbi:GntR family transcriptional regulator [Mycetocola zhujimingii]|uniref:GntR family transcriptional regulator n=1 Tax=Mycetocola zhujimingii TaxID=2079792 RepID=UPI000D375722|nr:GntR family transcriptional regulator [Mycetocola zhujimingii]AWB86071.1 GntR family transcriptional regulator [Mycetocola zhujimingii]
MVAIDLNGAAPPSEQIYQQLRGLILSGRIAAGERLPTVRQLARDLGVAPGTVARAYKQLELESSVQTRARGGTTVLSSSQSLSPEVLKAARALHDAAVRHGTSLEDSIATLTGIWDSGDGRNAAKSSE